MDPELERELEGGVPWMYPWQLEPGRETPLLGPELPSIHATRAELIEAPVRQALAAAGPEASALDLGCCEGWFSHKLIEWGAGRVLGVDAREHNVRRATLVRDHLGADPERLRFRTADVLALDPDELGGFDVVLVLGLIYHLERPAEALRLAGRLTGRLCVVETQLTRQVDPIVHGWGGADSLEAAPGSFAARLELDSADNPLASVVGVISLVPNRAALQLMLWRAGFTHLSFPVAAPHHNPQYQSGDRAVALAYPAPPAPAPAGASA